MQYIADYIMESSPLPFTFHIGFFEFIELLNNTPFDENEIKDITARIPSEFRAFINELGYKHTNNSRQNLLNINNLLKTARHNFITGKAPIGDI